MEKIGKYWAIITFAVVVVFAGGKFFQDIQVIKWQLESVDTSNVVRYGDAISLDLPDNSHNEGLTLNTNASGREKQAYIGPPTTLVIRQK